MLAGVLLHVVEPPCPVDAAGDGLPNLHFFIQCVENHALFFVDVQHAGVSQSAVIGGLSAALRIEGGAVQRHQKAVFARLTRLNHGGEFRQKRVGVVEFFSFHVENFLSFIRSTPQSARWVP